MNKEEIKTILKNPITYFLLALFILGIEIIVVVFAVIVGNEELLSFMQFFSGVFTMVCVLATIATIGYIMLIQGKERFPYK